MTLLLLAGMALQGNHASHKGQKPHLEMHRHHLTATSREMRRCYVCGYGMPVIFSMVATVLIPFVVFFALHMLFKQR
jgi:hypothetical protein